MTGVGDKKLGVGLIDTCRPIYLWINTHHQTSTLKTQWKDFFLFFISSLWCQQCHDPVVFMQISDLLSDALDPHYNYNGGNTSYNEDCCG